MTRLILPALSAIMTAALMVSCGADQDPAAKHGHDHGDGHDHGQQAASPFDGITQAVAVLQATEGNEASGTVTFTEADGQVRITAQVSGLEPGAQHAIHVHEYGDARAADGTSAGGHYNPEGHDHGLPDGEGPRHAGDLGNLLADDDGVATFELVVDNISIAGDSNPVLGRGMIVHAGKDTGEQPTGGAGPRIAIGVIGVGNPEQ